jgi:hypothetical protein
MVETMRTAMLILAYFVVPVVVFVLALVAAGR